ncbi:MAG: MarR family transcriptional regulator [Bacillota bacterium]|nr:MarR family transcriptional regulator [Bacillota bacterium]
MEAINYSIELARLCKDIMNLVRHKMTKEFIEMGITAPQGMVIGILSKFGKVKVSEISEKLGMTNSTVSGILDRLEKQNIIERIRSEEDKRVVYVNLTEEFNKKHRDFHKKAEDIFSDIVRKGTPEDIERIMTGLSALKKLLS